MLRPCLAILTAVIVAACTAGGGAAGSDDIDASPSPAQGPSWEPGTSAGVALPASITDPIVADAAARMGVDAPALTIVEATARTFPDGSLDCPEPGMMYTQALVDGYQVIVAANGTQLDYRGSGPGRFRICENP